MKLQGDKNSECKLSNGWWQNCWQLQPLLFFREYEWSQIYREMKEHPCLPGDMLTRGFLDPLRSLNQTLAATLRFG